MNKTAIKNFSIWARNALMDQVRTQMRLLGITEERIAEPLPQSAGHTQFFDIGTDQPYQIDGKAVDQRAHLVDHLRAQEKEEEGGYASAYEHVVEEAAYTWFNRLIAVRFMEVNGYLPWHVRVLSSESAGKIEPDLVSEPFSADGDIEMTDEEKRGILAMMEAQDADGLFSAMFLKACNALNKVLPKLFEKPADWTELLLNLSFVDRDGVVWHLVHDIPEEDFNVQQDGQIEILGWMFQFYNTEPKAEAYAKKGRFTKHEIPIVTEQFTPHWIVRYMVENSLGRLWSEGHPESTLKDHWSYYLDEAEQPAEVQRQMEEIYRHYAQLRPEDLTCIDPSCGSGHILVYLFDILMQIYESQGYTRRDAAQNILKYNLYGLDIDDRAAQIAYFSVLMKAREYDRRILDRKITPHVYAIPESNSINRGQLQLMGTELTEDDRKRAAAQMNGLLDVMKYAKIYGSIIAVKAYDWELLRRFVGEYERESQMDMSGIGIGDTEEQLQNIVAVGELLSHTYQVVVTNPPYMGGSTMNMDLSQAVKKVFPDSKADLFAVFMERCHAFTEKYGLQAMITMHAWMFLSSFEKLREKVLGESIVNMVHLGARAFEDIGGEVVQTTAFVLRNTRITNGTGLYCRLVDPTTQEGKEQMFLSGENRYTASQSNFSKIPGSPVAYWASEAMINIFLKSMSIEDLLNVRQGLATADNNRFTKLWNEVSITKCKFDSKDEDDLQESGKKWVPYNKGGQRRFWYGNYDYVVNWYNKGYEIKNFTDNHGHTRSVVRNTGYYFKPAITWGLITSGGFSIRYRLPGGIHDVAGMSAFSSSGNLALQKYILGVLATPIAQNVFNILNPTINLQVGDFKNFPVIINESRFSEVNAYVDQCIDLSKSDWDSFETSWDFQAHPFILYRKEHAEDEAYGLVENCYQAFKQTCEERFCRLKENEEELNRIFIDIYGLQEELTPEESGGDVTVARVYDEKKDIPEEMKRNKYVLTREDVMKSLISYAVGCMFGRYSLDEPGLAYAGGSWDPEKYRTFLPDEDNVIPITDEEYFRDDIVGRFCAWLKAAFGEENLEQNLDYIASSLHVKGDSSREIIRNYFLKDFFKDHCKTYSVTGSGKRPIYWLFDSGKQNGFKALIYMHRYDKSTIGRLRVEYLHRIQRVYDAEITRMQDVAERSGNASERARASKRAEKLIRQQAECRKYDENISHLALSEIEIDLDDGVKVNYEKVQTASDGKKYPVLAKI